MLFFTQLSYNLMCKLLKKSYMLSNYIMRTSFTSLVPLLVFFVRAIRLVKKFRVRSSGIGWWIRWAIYMYIHKYLMSSNARRAQWIKKDWKLPKINLISGPRPNVTQETKIVLTVDPSRTENSLRKPEHWDCLLYRLTIFRKSLLFTIL